MKRIIELIIGIITAGLLLSGCGVHHHQRQSTELASVRVNWRKPSEKKPYPKLSFNHQTRDWLLVSIPKQKVFVMSPKHRILYTMHASTGIHNSTPRGVYHIQGERGYFFYNQNSKEGAHYWTSWKDHGTYLFHTVPTNSKGHYNRSQANQLGRKANSHGCIRLSIPDARWINHHVPMGTKVVIK